jgi:stage V sporulation protein B
VYLNYSTKEIHDVYTTIDAYIIPLFTLASFLPFALSTAIIPHISETYVKNDINDLHNYIRKVYTFSIYPSMFCLIIIFFFNAEIMKLIYNTSIGLDIIKKFSLMFIFYYINAITASILQAMGKIKILFVNSVLINLIRLILIVLLSFISNIGTYSIIYAIMSTLIFSTISLFYILSKETKFKLLPNTVFKFIIFILFFVSFISLLNLFNIYYIKVILLSGLIFILLFYSILRKKL